MKKKDKLLWKVLRATTNSPNDVWKASHYKRHKKAPQKLKGEKIYRYTVPIKKVIDIKDDTIYLVVQFCTDDLALPYFVIDEKAFTKNLGAKEEYVYAINVRLCFKSEFRVRHRGQLNINGEVKERYRTDIFNDALCIIRDKPRNKIMSFMLNTNKYKSLTNEQISKLLYFDQFDENEKIYKGIRKTK